MFILILGLLIFLGVHSVRIFAPAWRKRRIAAIGDAPWRGFYSLTALIGFALIAWGFVIARPDAPILYEPPVWMKHIALALMPFAFISLMVFAFPAGRLKPVLKHPMLVSVKIWALAHLLANGDLASLLLFGAFLAWAVADRISIKRRDDDIPAPGPAKWDIMAAIAGVLVYVVFVWRLHEWLIGVTPLP